MTRTCYISMGWYWWCLLCTRQRTCYISMGWYWWCLLCTRQRTCYISMEWYWWCLLCTRQNTISGILIVRGQPNNNPTVDISFCSETLSWFQQKQMMFGSFLPPFIVRGFMSYLRYLCLFAYNGVQHILWFLFLFLFCLRLVSYVPNVVSFSWLSILYCPSVFFFYFRDI